MQDVSPSEAPAETQDIQSEDTPVAPSTGEETSDTTAAEYFEENFDPKALPEELQPAYKQMQAAWTKKTQSLAEQRKEAEAAIGFIEALQSEEKRGEALQQLAEAIGPEAVLEALGYEFDEGDEFDATDETPEEELSDVERLERRLAELEAEREAEKTAEQQAAEKAAEEAHLARIDEYVTDQLKALTGKHGEIGETYEKAIVSHALAAFEPDENGMPQIQAAYEDLEAIWGERQKQWLASKDAPSAPSSSGQPGQEKFNITDREARLKRMAAIMEAGD